MKTLFSKFEDKVQDQFNKMLVRKNKQCRKVIPTSLEIKWDEEEKDLSINFTYESEVRNVSINVLSMGCYEDDMTQDGLIEIFNDTLFGNSRTTWRQFDSMFDAFVDTLAEISVSGINQSEPEPEPEPEAKTTPLYKEVLPDLGKAFIEYTAPNSDDEAKGLFDVAVSRCYNEGHHLHFSDFDKRKFIIDTNDSDFINEIRMMLRTYGFEVLSKRWYELLPVLQTTSTLTG